MTIYIDNFFYWLQVFLFQPVIEIEITPKSLHIKSPHLIKYIKAYIIVDLNRSLLIEFNHIRQFATHNYSYISPTLD